MASNLSTIGFVFADHASYVATLLPLAEQATGRLACAAGEYGVWRSRTGAEIWFHLQRQAEGQTEIQGLTPFYNGETSAELSITAMHQGPNDNAFEGTLTAWVNPTEDGTDGDYPIVFDVVDYAGFDPSPLPQRRVVRLVAFAREVRGFVDEEAYNAYCETTGNADLRLAPAAFIPVGMFAEPGAEPPLAATSRAYFTGRVDAVSSYVNEATGHEFVAAVIETYGMRIDVVADPAIIDGPLQADSLVLISAHMFGRLTPEAQALA